MFLIRSNNLCENIIRLKKKADTEFQVKISTETKAFAIPTDAMTRKKKQNYSRSYVYVLY